MLSYSVVSNSEFLTLWTVACQAPPSLRFSRQEYWSGLPCPPPGDLPDPGIKAGSACLSCTAGLFTNRVTWEVLVEIGVTQK